MTERVGSRNPRPGQTRTQSAPAGPAQGLQLPQQTGQGSKIIVSNLPVDVTEAQIRELFASTIGAVSRVVLAYDSRGQSKGSAQVEFKKNDDATKAFQQYNKVRRPRRFQPCQSGLTRCWASSA